MKRLLLPLLASLSLPTSLYAFPFGDIVVKSNIGEKFIVKKSAVEEINYGNNFINIWFNKVEKDLIDTIDNWDKNKNDCFKSLIPKRRCKKVYYPDERLEKAKNDLDNLKNDKEYISNENYVHFKDIEFQPIYVNLNGQKIPSNIGKVACLNPQTSKRTIEIWNKYAGQETLKNNLPVKYSSSVYEQLKIKVCEKYAKFK